MSRSGFLPIRRAPVQLARKPKGEHEKCPFCQGKSRVSQPGDALENEADRAADAVMAHTSAPALGSAGGLFQRDPKDEKPVEGASPDKGPAPAPAATPAATPADPRGAGPAKPEPAGADKIVEAVAKTPAGKKIVDKAGEEARKVMSDPAGATAVGVMAGTAVAGLAAANQKLPFQPPAIPLGSSSYKIGLRYEGPMQTPSYVGARFSGNLPGEPKSPKHKGNDADAYRAETARMRADQESFRQHMTVVPSKPAAPAQGSAEVHAPAPSPPPTQKRDLTSAPVQRKAKGPATAPTAAMSVFEEAGNALDLATQRFMESRFGRDFSAVRIHAGVTGQHAANALNARAFTYGEHVAFSEGEYRPGTDAGRRLIAHELAHVAQQGAAPMVATSSVPAVRTTEYTKAPPVIHASSTMVARTEKPPDGAVKIKLGNAGKLSDLTFKVSPNDAEQGLPSGMRSFLVDMLSLPAAKGPNAKAAYKRFAEKGALAATVRIENGTASVSDYQARASAPQLQARWLDKRGWPRGKKATKYWQQAGGSDAFPKASKMCQMDHIVELQLTGNNTNENIQALDEDKNSESGSTLWAEVSGLARGIFRHPGLDKHGVEQIRMVFQDVDYRAAPPKIDTDCPATNKDCLAVEACADKIKSDENANGDDTEAYALKTDGGHQTKVRVPIGFTDQPGGKLEFASGNYNKAAATLIPGFEFKTLERRAKGGEHDTIKGAIDTKGETRLPLSFDDTAKKGTAINFTVADDHTIKLIRGNNVNIPFHYKYLSPGVIKRLEVTPKGMEFAGTIAPQIPFLGKLDIAYVDGVLSVTKGLERDNYKSPLPNTKITKAEIGMELAPEFKAKGDLAFEYVPAGKKLLDAALKATADTEGLKITGDVWAYLPGIDQAHGNLSYSIKEGWTGGVDASASDLKKKFHYVSSGTVSIGVMSKKDGGVDVAAEGSVTLNLPHTQGVTATLHNRQGHWSFQGKGTFEVPRLKPVDITVEYDGEHLTGDVSNVGFKYRDCVDASINVHYRDEKFSGAGKMKFAKGRAKGELLVNLLPTERFAGKGEITLQLRDDLEATAGVELDEHEKLHVKGMLAFAKPIKLFEGFGGDATLLKLGVDIPIPGASLGTIGLNARINGQLSAGYHVGPGEIRNASAAVRMDPLEDNPKIEFDIGGQLWVGASAHINGSISGGVALKVLVAEASGELTVSATAMLNGEVVSNAQLHYSRERIALTADFSASLALAIRLALEASVRAAAGIAPLEVATEKRWTLAAKEFNTGLKLGIKLNKPLSYSSDKGLEVPSASDVEVTKPNLDPSRLLKDVFGSADAKETKK